MRGLKILTGNPKELAQRALKARLYVNGWTLRDDLTNFNSKEDLIALAVLDGVPIGVCIGYYGCYLSVFIRKAHRRKGVGSKLVEKVKGMSSQRLSAGSGVAGSMEFWKAVGVAAY